MAGIFISYRRDDSRDVTGRLYDHLYERFGKQVFLDLEIPPGVDFVDVLEQTVHKCDVLLVVIGPHWLDTRNEAGVRRLDDSNDYVRMEVAGALARKIRVIPVLVNGAPIPRPADLPECLSSLARRQAFEMSDKRFRDDAVRLIEVLEEVIKECGDSASSQQNESPRPAAAKPVATPPPNPAPASNTAPAATLPPVPPQILTPQFFFGRWRVEGFFGSDIVYMPDGAFSGVVVQNIAGYNNYANVFGRWNMQVMGPDVFQLQLWFANMTTWAGTFRILDADHIQNLENNYTASRVR